MRYVQGLAVAVLMVAVYLVATGGLSTPPQAPLPPAPAIVVPSGPPPIPSTVSPPQDSSPPHFVTLRPGDLPTPQPPSAGPTRHLHSGPPLH